MAKALILLIRLYQRLVSPFLGSHCRFVPSCSSYACDALARYGTAGLFLAVRRVCRCHPLCPGGYDPVPDAIQCKRRGDACER